MTIATIAEQEAAVALQMAKAQSTSNDGVTVSRRSAADQILWLQYQRNAELAADTSGRFPLRIFQGVPSGGPR